MGKNPKSVLHFKGSSKRLSVPRATIHVRCRHATALHVLGMPSHCTGIILGVSVTHPWPASPCSALIPEMLVGSDGTSQRLRTRRSLQEARDHHVFELDPLVCTRGLGVGHCPGRFWSLGGSEIHHSTIHGRERTELN